MEDKTFLLQSGFIDWQPLTREFVNKLPDSLAGVYQLRVSKHRYIGSSYKLKNRLLAHISNILNGRLTILISKLLTEGNLSLNDFEFCILESTEDQSRYAETKYHDRYFSKWVRTTDLLRLKELFYIERLNPELNVRGFDGNKSCEAVKVATERSSQKRKAVKKYIEWAGLPEFYYLQPVSNRQYDELAEDYGDLQLSLLPYEFIEERDQVVRPYRRRKLVKKIKSAHHDSIPKRFDHD